VGSAEWPSGDRNPAHRRIGQQSETAARAPALRRLPAQTHPLHRPARDGRGLSHDEAPPRAGLQKPPDRPGTGAPSPSPQRHGPPRDGAPALVLLSRTSSRRRRPDRRSLSGPARSRSATAALAGARTALPESGEGRPPQTNGRRAVTATYGESGVKNEGQMIEGRFPDLDETVLTCGLLSGRRDLNPRPLTPSSHVGQRHARARLPWSVTSVLSRVKVFTPLPPASIDGPARLQ
jgi:hypothetical protein